MNLRPSGVVRSIEWFGSNPTYRFALLFLIYLGVAGFGYPRVRAHFKAAGDAMIIGIAKIEHFLFSLFSSDASISGRQVVFGGFSVEIIEECTAMYEILIFAAAVFAFPTRWGKRAIGLGLGIPLLFAINLGRIAMLIVVGRYYPSVFDFMHVYFWQATLILMITSVWLLWILKVVRNEEEALPSRS
ncbi:archaeosortase/exosortase family protein [bacterium]|nr:archaeosortase/exosortase family protein [bacterium]